MLLAIDIGNTNIHVGMFEGEELKSFFYMGCDQSRSGDELAFTLKSLIEAQGYGVDIFEGAVVGSVSPHITGKVEYAVQKVTKIKPLLVGPGTKTGFLIKLDDPTQLGADLVANSAGTISEFGAPAIVVDFGTATTVSCINRDKSYAGCYIMPGIQMSLDALNQTGLLPSIMADNSFPVIGKNSIDSMRAGVIFGSVLSCEGFIDTFKKELDLPKTTPVIVTGGFAEPFLSYFNMKIRHVPNLTLKGLRVIYSLNKQGRK
ncbi:MAG: type III pantothenate kinase [Clostridia bacterium]|nr:type III pantothenate kinase [Clostridia bacterium]